MKYDDASWHYGGNFPTDLANEAGATHIGMFVAWAVLTDLAGEFHIEQSPERITKLRSRQVTPAQFFIEACDEKFTEEDLNAEGNAFAMWYYVGEDATYLSDYDDYLGEKYPTLYHVEDTWDSFDLLKPVLDKRFNYWKESI